jgi:hypothetical protein
MFNRKQRNPRETFPCPHCGYEVPDGALACPDCGSDDETGWSETAYVGGLDLPEPGWGDEIEPEPTATLMPRAVLITVAIIMAVVFFLVTL